MRSSNSTPYLSVPHFPPQPFAREVLLEKYARAGEVDASQIQARVATALAASEQPDKSAYYTERFLWALRNGFIPAGRIDANAGTGLAATLLNCFVQPIGDSIAAPVDAKPGVYSALAEAAETLRRGGGVGYNFSALRPRGAGVQSTERQASGPLSYMEIFDRSCATIAINGASKEDKENKENGARRGAQMAVLNIEHPDIEAFIAAKQQRGRFNHFNLSVGVSDVFMRALHDDSEFELVHRAAPGAEQIAQGARQRGDGWWIYRSVAARALWEQIMRAAYAAAEPGVLFLDHINGANNLHYCESIEATNPCGEQPLPAYGSCCLGSINLTAFVRDAFSARASFNYPHMMQVIRCAIRMLDNVIDVTPWPLPAQQRVGLATRRIGLGFTGLGDALLMLGLRYDTAAARTAAAILAEVLRNTAYTASIDLAAERGAFPLFDCERYLRGEFIARLPETLRKRLRHGGIRNSHLLSIAPAGSISLAFGDNVSNGIEPAFAWRYRRAKCAADGTQKISEVEDYAYRRFRLEGRAIDRLPAEFIDAWHIDPRDHVRMAVAVAPYIDAGISKTVNVAIDFPYEQFKELYAQAWRGGLKGITTYRPNTVTGAVLFDPQPCGQDFAPCDL